MKKLILYILFFPAFIFSNVYWPSLQGNLYFTGNNDEIVPHQKQLQWTFQGKAGLIFPVPAGDKIFISSFDHYLYCLDISTGKELWKFNSGFPIIKSPIADNHSVFLTSGKTLFSLNISSGEIQWAQTESHYITTTPVLYKNNIYYATRENIICRSSSRGNLLWKCNAPVYGGTSTAFDNMIFIHSRSYLKQEFQIMALASSNGRILWKKDITKGIVIFTPVVYNKKIYIGTKNILYCLDAYTGHTCWVRNFPDNIISEAAFNNKALFLTTESGTFYKIDPLTGKTLQYFSFSKGRNYFSLAGETAFILNRTTDTISKIDLTDNTVTPFYQFHLKNYGHYFAIDKGNIFIPLNHQLFNIGAPIQTEPKLSSQQIVRGILSPAVNADILFRTQQFQKHISVTNGRFSFSIPENSKNAALYIAGQGYQYMKIPLSGPADLNIKLKPLTQSQAFVFHNIYFDYNRADIKKSSIDLLKNITVYLQHNTNLNVQINGYTDNIGSEKFNKELSLKRAEKIKEYLVKNGINENRLTIQGLGESRPAADNKTEEGRAKNRRIEFILTKK